MFWVSLSVVVKLDFLVMAIIFEKQLEFVDPSIRQSKVVNPRAGQLEVVNPRIEQLEVVNPKP